MDNKEFRDLFAEEIEATIEEVSTLMDEEQANKAFEDYLESDASKEKDNMAEEVAYQLKSMKSSGFHLR